MISGAHVIVYSKDAESDRAFFRDVLGFKVIRSDAHLATLMGEDVVFGQPTTGAESDLKAATGLARRMVGLWGMSEDVGPVSYGVGETQPFLGRGFARIEACTPPTTTKSRACAATAKRLTSPRCARPSKRKGLVTTAIVSAPS